MSLPSFIKCSKPRKYIYRFRPYLIPKPRVRHGTSSIIRPVGHSSRFPLAPSPPRHLALPNLVLLNVSSESNQPEVTNEERITTITTPPTSNRQQKDEVIEMEKPTPLLFDHQREAILFLEATLPNAQLALLDMVMGSGKTAIVLSWLNYHPDWTVLFLTLPSVTTHIFDEINKWYKGPKSNILLADVYNMRNLVGTTFHCVVVDECHRLISNPKSMMVKRLTTIRRFMTVLMSGTPRSESQFYALALFGANTNIVCQRFQLHKTPDLRPVAREFVRLNLTQEQRNGYDLLAQDVKQQKGIHKQHSLRKLRRQLTLWKHDFVLHYLRDEIGKNVGKEVERKSRHEQGNLTNDLPPPMKIIVTSIFADVLTSFHARFVQQLRDECAKISQPLSEIPDIKVPLVTSELSKSQRLRCIKQFFAHPNPPVLFAAAELIDHGLDLAKCTLLLVLEVAFKYKQQEQLSFRLERIGQTECPQRVVFFGFDDTFESRCFQCNNPSG